MKLLFVATNQHPTFIDLADFGLSECPELRTSFIEHIGFDSRHAVWALLSQAQITMNPRFFDIGIGQSLAVFLEWVDSAKHC